MSIFDKKPSDSITKFCIVAVVLGVLFLVTGAAEAADPASWNNLTFNGTTADGYSLTIEEAFRYDAVGFSGDAARHTDVRVGKSFGGFTGIFGYRDTNDGANRTYAGVSYDLGAISGWDTDVSTIFELNGDDVRNRTKFSALSQTAVAGFTPYLTTEFFTDVDGSVDSNRSTFGVAKSIADGYAVSTWYQADKSFADAEDASAVGLGLNVSF